MRVQVLVTGLVFVSMAAGCGRDASCVELLKAAARGDEQEVAEQLNEGVLPDCANSGDEDSASTTALVLAAASGHAGVVKILLDAGADPDLRCADGDDEVITSPLIEAIYAGSVDCTRAILAAGADPEQCSDDGVSPLMSVMYGGGASAIDLMSLLLEEGADPNRIQVLEFAPEGSPLSVAISFGAVERVRVLVSHGADPELRVRGKTAYEWLELVAAVNRRVASRRTRILEIMRSGS